MCQAAHQAVYLPNDRAKAAAAAEQLEVCQGSSREAVLQQLHAAQPAAEMLLRDWRQPETQATLQLQVAQATAARSCANLRCANLGGCTGGPAAGEGVGAKRCR